MKKFNTLILLLSFLISGYATPLEDYEKADLLAKDGRTKEALSILSNLNQTKITPIKALALEIYLLADAGDTNKATNLADRYAEAHFKEPAIWLAKAYAHKKAEQHTHALRAYSRVLELEPNNKDALEGRVISFKNMRNFTLAWKEAQKTPELFKTIWTELRHSYAVELLKLHQAGVGEGSKNFTWLDESIALMQMNKAPTKSQYSDLILAIHERNQHETVIRMYEEVKHTSGIGSWVDLPIASSLTSRGRYREAVDLLEKSNKERPDEIKTVYALAYAYADLGKFDTATDLIANLEKTLSAKGDKKELFFTKKLTIQLHLWAGRLKQAEDLLEKALADSPANVDFKRLMAQLKAYKGDYATAKAELRELMSQNNKDLDSQLAVIALEYENAPEGSASKLDALSLKFPNSGEVIRAKRDLELSKRAYVYARTSITKERDSTTTSVQIEVASPALTKNGLRVTGEVVTNDSKLQEGGSTQTQLAVGLYQPLPLNSYVSLAAVKNLNSNDAGLRFKVVSNFLPKVKTTFQATTLKAEVPARAAKLGITSKSMRLEVEPELITGVDIGISGYAQSLSDENKRFGLASSIGGKIYPGNNLEIDWKLRAGLETASKEDAVYFNPKKSSWTDAEIGLKLPSLNVWGNQYVVFKPSFSLGTYSQSGYGNLMTSGFGISSIWPINKDINLSIDFKSVKRPYDGIYTIQNTGSISLFSKFN